MRRSRKRAALCGMLFGIYMALAFVNPWMGRTSLAGLVLQLSGSRGEFPLGFSLAELTEFQLRMLPGYVVMMVWGKSLYRHFCVSSIYVFSRCPGRMKWYRQEISSLLVDICIYEMVHMGTIILFTALRYEIYGFREGILLLGFHIVIYTGWIFGWSLAVNLCAVKMGSSLAFSVAAGFQIISTAGLGIIGALQRGGADPGTVEGLLEWNLAAHTVLGWQKHGALREALASSPYSMSLSASAFLILFLAAVAVAVGAFVVSRVDFLTDDMERETI